MPLSRDVDGGEAAAPPGVDTRVAHSARVYDWFLGGKDNFAADRAVGEAVVKAIPTIRIMAQENRHFLGRVVRYLAGEAGISQFLDIGTGIPTSPNVHEIAQETVPDAHVVYVDNDPIVLAHARALMVSGSLGKTAYIDADLREPEKILTDSSLTHTLDLSKPVGLIMLATLMLLGDEDDPWGKVDTLKAALPPGSYFAISHHGQEFNPEAMGANVAAAAQAGVTLVPRTRAEVERFFDGWELIEPGVVPLVTWHPVGDSPADPNAAYLWAGVARKP
jgi:hypothetical protein